MDLYEKILKIGVLDENIGLLEVPLKVINIPDSGFTSRIGRIKAKNIVGTTRISAEGAVWADILNDLFHKEYWLRPEQIKEINKILQMPFDNIYPSVVEKDSQYYIDGDGFHRLVIAKLLDVDNIVVYIKRYNNT